MADDRYLKPFEQAQKPHLLRGSGGVQAEVADLRKDVSRAFGRIATELDTVAGGLAPVADLAALSALDATSVNEGNLIYVSSVDDIYVLDKTGSYTEDGLTVIAALGGGFWIARIVGRWNDLQGEIADGVAAGSMTFEPFRDTPFRMFFSRHDQDDELHFKYQFPHGWDYTKPVIPHLHVLPMSSPGADENAYFSGYYAWTRPFQDPIPALAGWTGFNATLVVPPGAAYVQRVVSLGTLTPPAIARESSILLLYVRREGTNILDTYSTSKASGTPAANLGILSSDVHFQFNKHASVTALPTEG